MKRLTTLMLLGTIFATGCAEESGIPVGPRGGLVASPSEYFSVEIPRGALDQEIEIVVDQVECEHPGATGPCYATEPFGLPLLRPATITVILDEALLDDEVDRVTILTEKEEGWRPLSDLEVDGNVVTASVVYLGDYVVVVDRVDGDDDDDDEDE